MLELLVGGVIGVFIGWRLRELHAQMILNHLLNNKDNEDKLTADNTISLKLRHEHDSVYVYDKSDVFLIQVKSKSEFFKFVESKFSNKNVIISKDDMAVLDRL